jgi:hypothetical protein
MKWFQFSSLLFAHKIQRASKKRTSKEFLRQEPLKKDYISSNVSQIYTLCFWVNR